jgi:hypothetical protein
MVFMLDAPETKEPGWHYRANQTWQGEWEKAGQAE